MENYLDSDLDIHTVVILSDGFDWELWIRPKGESIDDLDNPVQEASLRDSLRTVRTRNMQTASYRPHKVRSNIDTEAFSEFAVDSVLNVIEAKFGVPVTDF